MIQKLLRLLVIGLLAIACGPSTKTLPTGGPPTSIPTLIPSASSGFSLLIAAKGSVQLKRTNWADFYPTAFGAELHRGDLLKLDKGSKATILCDDLTVWQVPVGVVSGVSNGCSSGPNPDLSRNGSSIGRTRGPIDPSIPYIIGPRMTHLLTDTPILRWNEVTGTLTYTVRLMKSTDLIWKAETLTTKLVYPGEPPLRAGTIYRLVVESDNNRISSDEGVPGLGFSLLDATEAQAVQDAVRPLARLNMTDEARTLAIAYRYAEYDLIAEAIDNLERLVAMGREPAAIHRMLGNLYWQIGLSRLAEKYFLLANTTSQSSGDIEGQAISLSKLGDIYLALGNKPEAVQILSKAQALYEVLGDSVIANEIAQRIELLQLP